MSRKLHRLQRLQVHLQFCDPTPLNRGLTVYMPGFSSVLCSSLISASRFVSVFSVSSSPGGAGSVSDSDSDVSLSLASPTS